MKGGRLYFFILFAFLIFVFLMELAAPHQFVWKPTYDKYDKEPFGSFVFDDVLSSSVDNYTVVNKTFYQIVQEDSVINGHAFLLSEANLTFNDTDIEYLYKIIHGGNQVMICSDNFPYKLRDTLHFYVNFESYSRFNLKELFINKDRDSIFFGSDTLNPVQIYEVFPQVHPVSIMQGRYQRDNSNDGEDKDEADEDSSTEKTDNMNRMNCDSVETLVWNNHNKPLAVRVFIGKGELLLVSTPLMFTNFGMLDGTNASYAFRLLSCLKDKPLIRIEAYGCHGIQPRTPLRYILSEPPLRWAIYSGMTILIFFMAFTVKRRQRIIPVVTAPQNLTLGFMQLISNLYYQKHNNIEILKMKYKFFCTDVKNLIGIELYEQAPCDSDYERFVEKTGMEKGFIITLLHNIRLATYREEVNDMHLRQYIDGMNELLFALKT